MAAFLVKNRPRNGNVPIAFQFYFNSVVSYNANGDLVDVAVSDIAFIKGAVAPAALSQRYSNVNAAISLPVLDMLSG